jgi:hypothetical protein
MTSSSDFIKKKFKSKKFTTYASKVDKKLREWIQDPSLGLPSVVSILAFGSKKI